MSWRRAPPRRGRRRRRTSRRDSPDRRGLPRPGGVASGGAGTRVEPLDQLRVRDVAGLRYPAVAVLACQGGALRAAGGHEDRRWGGGRVVEFQRVGLKIASRERYSLTTPQLTDQLDGLDQPVVTFAVATECVRGGLLVEPFAGAEAQEHPSRAQHRKGGESMGDRCRVMAVHRTGHSGTERDVTGVVADQGQRQPWKHRMALVVLPWLNVVAGPNMLKAGLFGDPRLGEELIGAELLMRQHQTHALARGRCGSGGTTALVCVAAAGQPTGAERPDPGGQLPEHPPRHTGHRIRVPESQDSYALWPLA